MIHTNNISTTIQHVIKTVRPMVVLIQGVDDSGSYGPTSVTSYSANTSAAMQKIRISRHIKANNDVYIYIYVYILWETQIGT